MKIMLAMLVNLLESLDQIVIEEAKSVLGVLKDLLTKLGGERGEVWLGELKKFCRGEACWNNFTQVFTPSCPPGLTIARDRDQITSRVRDTRNLSACSVRLHLDHCQSGRELATGYELKEKLEGQAVYGEQLLDFYLEHPDLIPVEWRTAGAIYFWGTIFRDSDGRLYVRNLLWFGEEWTSRYVRLDRIWRTSCPAAVSASPQV